MIRADDKRRKPQIRTHLWLGMLAIVILMGTVALVAISERLIMEHSFALLDHIDTVERLLLECRRQEKNFLLRGDEASLNLHSRSFEELLANTTDPELESVSDAAIRVRLTRLRDRESEYGQAFESLKTALLADPTLRRDPPEEMTVARARECHALLAELRALARTRFTRAGWTANLVSALSVVVGLVASLVIAGLLTRSIVGPLEYLRALAARVSTGDIQDMDVEFSDLEARRFKTRETLDLAASLQRMVTSIRLLISTERGLMDDYHMTIVVLVNKAVGPGGWTVVEKACRAAGLGSFTEVRPANVGRFLDGLRQAAAPLIPEERIRLLSAAIAELPAER